MEPQSGLSDHTERDVSRANGKAGDFIAICAHELLSSLSGVRNAANVLRVEISAGLAVAQAHLLIERQMERMSRLLDHLLDVYGAGSGVLRLRRERMDLCAVVMMSVKAVELTLNREDRRLTTSLPDECLWLHADSSRLEQVFVNLLVNAVRQTDAGGEISLSVTVEGGDAVVRIRDTGSGIAPAALPHVFDLLFRANASASADRSLGIGLALVRSLVECHQGHVTAVSAGAGLGSEFTVRLPAG